MMIRKLLVSAATLALMTGAAWAADLPNTKGPPVFAPPPPPAFTWTGVYIGGQVGYEWGNDTTTEFDPAGVPDGFVQGFRTNGVNGGGHIGFNYQVSQFVFGLEGDVNGADNRGGFTLPNGNFEHVRDEIEAAILGRAGVAWDRVLIYAQGGAAFANFRYNYFNAGTGVGEIFNDGRVGWTVGVGIEYAIDPNWTIFADYRYSDYGRFSNTSAFAFPGFTERQHPRENLVQAGFSYKFDIFGPPAAPIVSKY